MDKGGSIVLKWGQKKPALHKKLQSGTLWCTIDIYSHALYIFYATLQWTLHDRFLFEVANSLFTVIMGCFCS